MWAGQSALKSYKNEENREEPMELWVMTEKIRTTNVLQNFRSHRESYCYKDVTFPLESQWH